MTVETVHDYRALMEWDWLGCWRGRWLHHADLTTEQLEAMVNEGNVGEWITFTCGVRANSAGIPGIFDRMRAVRCPRCCDRLGYPRGVGSPKNDEALRPLVKARLSA